VVPAPAAAGRSRRGGGCLCGAPTVSFAGGAGNRLGIYPISANDLSLRNDLGALRGGERPALIAYAPCFDRQVDSSPVPEALFGVWKIRELGRLAATGWQGGELSLGSDGRFALSGRNVVCPIGEAAIGGSYTISDRAATAFPHLTVEVETTDGDVPSFHRGEVKPGISRLADGKLSLPWGSAT
jgi:hypothetical protein